MQIEDYFDFLAPDDIRFRGHRIGIEGVLYEYIHRAQTAEEIVKKYETLSLEQVYAAILYYLQNTQAMDHYLAQWLEHCRQSVAEQRQRAPELRDLVLRLKTNTARQPA